MATKGTSLDELADTAAAVAATASRKEKSALLADLLKRLKPDEIEPTIGFLTASVRQGAIGVGWAAVSKAADTAKAGDPASGGAEGEPTVLDFDRLVEELAVQHGAGSEGRRHELLGAFMQACRPETRDFIARSLTGEARLGALAGVMADAVAKATGIKAATVRRAIMLQGDLGQAAHLALTEGGEAVEAVDLQVGRPIQPMLASTSPSAREAAEALGTYIAEWKLDGARIQVHVDHSGPATTRPSVKILTRNLNDVTSRLRSVVDVVAEFECTSAVLDGEILGFGNEDERPDQFQDTISSFSTKANAAPDDDANGDGRRLKPHFFDLMYLNGQSLIDTPLSQRATLLRSLAPNHCIPMITSGDPGDAENLLTQSLDAGHEGIMVKGASGLYEAVRRGKSWRKVKPVYTFDLVVLAAEWGYGRRQGWLSNLHLGARNTDDDGFVMVGKTFKGLTDATLAWQTENFPAYEDDARSTPSTVALHPHFVAEVAIDGVQRSTRYPGGVALRFARLKRYRDDRTPANADTIEQLQALLRP